MRNLTHFAPIPLISAIFFILGACSPKSEAPAKAEELPRPAPQLLSDTFEEVQAPEKYRARFEIAKKGHFVIEVTRSSAPRAADRFYNLVKVGFFDQAPFFRVTKDWVIQWGISGFPEVQRKFAARQIQDEEPGTPKKAHHKWTVTFAKRGPNSRSTQVFISVDNNESKLGDQAGFPPFGKVVEGRDVVEKIFVVGEMRGQRKGEKGVVAKRLASEGLEYIRREFPRVDLVEKAVIE